MVTQTYEIQKTKRKHKRWKGQLAKKYQTGLITYIMCELMLSKISCVMLWASSVKDTDSIYFLCQLVFGIQTGRNVLTIQNSNGTFTQTVLYV